MVDIQLPAAYPFEPPKMRFVTKVWCDAHAHAHARTGPCRAAAACGAPRSARARSAALTWHAWRPRPRAVTPT